jgi:hypothetical protein
MIIGKTRFADGLDVGNARILSKDFGLNKWVNRGVSIKLGDLGGGKFKEVRN